MTAGEKSPAGAASAGRRLVGKIAYLGRETPWTWAVIAFAAYFYYAQFIVTVAWNAIELIIAQHLLDHGVYATSTDYPSALSWRPLLPTLLVTFFRIWTSDPMLIYRLICGTSLAALVASMFLSARVLWGRASAHAAAFLTLTCPAITLQLIDHPHSYSHLGMLLVLGPTLLLSLHLLRDDGTRAHRHRNLLYALAGLLWALCYLSRSELLLFAGLHFTFLAWRQRRRLWAMRRPFSAYLLVFAGIFSAYNVVAARLAARDGILIRKTIYGFYMSQGWADPPPNLKPDVEADGYAYAIRLYGDPLANHESMLTAISHNPAAFAHRVQLNLKNFYARYADQNFFPAAWSLMALGLVGLLLLGRLPRDERPAVIFLGSLFLASHCMLIFHIDARYLSINIPPLLLLMAGLVHHVVQQLSRLPRGPAGVIGLVLLGGLLYGSRTQFRNWREHRKPNTVSLAAMKALGRHFNSIPKSRGLSPNREPHIGFFFATASPLYPEDQFLLAYFTHSAWVNRGAEGAFRRGKFYSFRDCPDDYQYVPAEQIDAFGGAKSPKVVSLYESPALGKYYLLKTSP